MIMRWNEVSLKGIQFPPKAWVASWNYLLSLSSSHVDEDPDQSDVLVSLKHQDLILLQHGLQARQTHHSLYHSMTCKKVLHLLGGGVNLHLFFFLNILEILTFFVFVFSGIAIPSLASHPWPVQNGWTYVALLLRSLRYRNLPTVARCIAWTVGEWMTEWVNGWMIEWVSEMNEVFGLSGVGEWMNQCSQCAYPFIKDLICEGNISNG